MNLVRANEGSHYSAPGHFGCELFSKQTAQVSGNEHLEVNLSRLEPGGGCEFGGIPPVPITLCYYVLKGEITVTTQDDQFVMREGDCVLWNKDDSRGFVNEGDTLAELLVIVGK